MIRYLFMSLFLSVALSMVSASPFAGTWHGELQLGAEQLPLVLHVAEGASGFEVTMDSPMQGAYGIPASAYTENDKITVKAEEPPIIYTGVMKDGKIAGKFCQSGYEFPLIFEPGDYVPVRPQTPKPPFPYSTQEVTFVNPVDSAVLAGTLTMPLNSIFRGKIVPVPVVLMVTGSGQQNRDEELFGHKPFAVLAHNLALNGIASLRYDDRGFGQSAGDIAQATTATFAGDAEAGINWLRAKGDIFSRVGLLGHSEGGQIAYMLAAKSVPDFIVSIAGPTLRGDSILIEQNRMIMQSAGFAPIEIEDYISGLRRVFLLMEKGKGPEDTDFSDLQHLKPQQVENLNGILRSATPWLRNFVAYDPEYDIMKIGCPMFAIWGEKDIQVPAVPNSEKLSDSVVFSDKSDSRIYPGLNHLMQQCSTGMPDEYGRIQQTISPVVIEDIIRWIKSL